MQQNYTCNVTASYYILKIQSVTPCNLKKRDDNMKRKWLIQIRGIRTQEDIAKEAGISRSLYTQIEIGIRNPSVSTAKTIAKVLNFNWVIFFENKCSAAEQKAI